MSDPDESSREPEGRIGQTLLGKWHLDSLLGEGAMAAVYAATHRNGARGAVKMLHHALSLDSGMRQRFLREGYIANKVDHPGAVRVLDDDVTLDGSAFLVMELLDGRPLHDVATLAGGTLDAQRVLMLSDQLLDTLAAAHDQGIVHRDIKPENLFVTADGRLKVLDFGIAHLAESPLAVRATQSGMPMGTPAFMAPEQARGRWDLVGPQSDVWAVGATMFTLLSGVFVHEAETVAELLANVILRPARRLATVCPGAPESVVALVDRALQIDLNARWSDARAMQSAVRAAYRELTGEPIPTRLPPPATPSSLRPTTETIAATPTRAEFTHASLTSMPPSPPPPRRRAAAVMTVVGALIVALAIARAPSAAPRSLAASSAFAPPRAAESFLAETLPPPSAPLDSNPSALSAPSAAPPPPELPRRAAPSTPAARPLAQVAASVVAPPIAPIAEPKPEARTNPPAPQLVSIAPTPPATPRTAASAHPAVAPQRSLAGRADSDLKALFDRRH